jgi:hypothetical protein
MAGMNNRTLWLLLGMVELSVFWALLHYHHERLARIIVAIIIAQTAYDVIQKRKSSE